MKQPRTLNVVFSILKQCIQAIAEIHSAGICHRDIKPENFMISLTEQVKLIDFGLAEFEANMKQKAIGSLLWMAPEVLNQGETFPISKNSDIWSFGVMLVELVTGENPCYFPQDSKKTIETIASLKSPPIPQRMKDDTSKLGIFFYNMANMCLQIDPAKRQSSFILARLFCAFRA
jgi:serine/threonine protein kinase